LVPTGWGRIKGKGEGGEYLRNIMYSLYESGPMRPGEIVLRMWVGRIKENDGGSEFS
jgi:hypothetical protein